MVLSVCLSVCVLVRGWVGELSALMRLGGRPVGQPSLVKHLLPWTLATYVSPQIIESITTALSPPRFSHKTSRMKRSSVTELQLGPSAEHLAQ